MRWRLLVVLSFGVFGCAEAREATARPERNEAPPAAESTPDVPCAEMTRHACLRSVLCTLHRPEQGPYECRPAAGNCEVGLRQIPADEDRCNDRDGCRFQPARCYCPCRGAGRSAVPDGAEARDCDCECGGGQPDRCVR